MNETLILVKWVAVFVLTGLLGSALFIGENSKMLRYTVGKALGIIVLAATSWLLSISHILPFTGASLWAVYLVALGLVFNFRHKYIFKFFRQNYKQILIIESIIFGLFIIFINIRMMAPKIEGVEKYMDMAILTGLMRHKTGVPLDTWYAPSNINYYYFGHWIVASWAKLSSVSANYAFNLGFASILSLVGGMIFAIVHKLSNKLWAGFLGLFFALFASNIFAFISYLNNTASDFFKSGRFVEEVINEYPLYSIVLGDLHAHMLGLILSVALFGMVVIVSDENIKIPKRLDYAVIGVLLGLMALTNSFDIINCSVLLTFYFAWEYFIRKISLAGIVQRALPIIIPFVILMFVSMLTFSPAVSGIQISIFKTPLLHIFWQFGAVIALIIACFTTILLQPKRRVFVKKFVKSYKFVIVIFIAAALSLILITELIYFKDIYHYANPPYARANTQFKIWYSAWILLAIAAASIYGYAFEYVKNIKYKFFLIFVAFISIGVTLFGTVSGYSYSNKLDEGSNRIINGTKYLQKTDPNKLAIINYVNQNISGQPIILQNGGESYSTNSWLSAYTGTASYLGWRSHEWGWRYNDNAWATISKKYGDIQSAYEASNPNDLISTLKNIKAGYLLLGPDETGTFTNTNKQNIQDTLGEPVFSSGPYELYSVTN